MEPETLEKIEPSHHSSLRTKPTHEDDTRHDDNDSLTVADFLESQDTADRSIEACRKRYEDLKTFLDAAGPAIDLDAAGTYGLRPLQILLFRASLPENEGIDCAHLLVSRGANIDWVSSFRTVFKQYRQTLMSTWNAMGPDFENALQYGLLNIKYPDKLNVEYCTNSPADARLRSADARLRSTRTIRPDHHFGTYLLGLDEGQHRDGTDFSLGWFNVFENNDVIVYRLVQALIARDSFRKASQPKCTSKPWKFMLKFLASESELGNPALKSHSPQYAKPVGCSHCSDTRNFFMISLPYMTMRSVKDHLHARKEGTQIQSLLSSAQFCSHPLGNRTLLLNRTLDEAYYPGLGPRQLNRRNEDQVVSRYRAYSTSKPQDRSIILVPHLRIWRLGNYIISANFGNFSDDLLFRLDLKYRISALEPDELVCLLIARHIKRLGEANSSRNGDFPPILNIFEDTVISILSEVEDYVRAPQSTVLDLEKEDRFIHDVADIRAELVMIQDVLNQQEHVLLDYLNDFDLQIQRNKQIGNDSALPLKGWEELRDAQAMFPVYRKRIQKIDSDAERIEQTIQQQLQLKRTAANMHLAEASIQEARDSKMLSLVVIGFTVVTILFTPLSFLVGLFALQIDTFGPLKIAKKPSSGSTQSAQSAGTENNDDAYSGKKLAGIFIAVEALTIILTVFLSYCIMKILLRYLMPLSKLFGRTPLTSNRDTFEESDASLQDSTKEDSSGKESAAESSGTSNKIEDAPGHVLENSWIRRRFGRGNGKGERAVEVV